MTSESIPTSQNSKSQVSHAFKLNLKKSTRVSDDAEFAALCWGNSKKQF